MRMVAVLILRFLSVPVNAEQEPGSEQASQAKAHGMVYATAKVADDLKTEFLDGPNSELPDTVIAKLSPSLMAKARKAHAAAPAEDGIYRVAIDWKVISVNGQDQMKFEFSNSEPFPIRKVKPVYRRQNATMSVEIVYRIGVAPDGTVTDISRDDGSSGDPDLFRAGRKALKQWTFSPRYKNGVAVADELRFPLVFDLTAETEVYGAQSHGL